MKLIQYVRLLKFRYHLSFICVITGALIFSDQSLFTLIKQLLILYISFNVLLYGGLYALNDIADIESDRKHPKKKYRPLPSKSISVLSALTFAFIFMIIGLAVSYFYFGRVMFLMYLLFILVNQVYTHVAKKIPYVEILVNSLTYPMRFFLGVLLVTGKVPYFLLIAVLLIAFGFACVRRIIEKRAPGWEARHVLKYYTEAKLIVIQIITLSLILVVLVIDYPFYIIWYLVIILLYLLFVFGIHFSEQFVRFYKWLFLN